MAKRPTIKKPPPPADPGSPEELFYSLSGRAKSHAYLRGPQQDALREYVKEETHRDIAFELPTGAGKTTVGLLIAEWQRRKTKGRAAFLTLTNQLAAQVISEANSLGLNVADLRGGRERRSAAEEGRFLQGAAVGVSTYSNLFNVSPVVHDCDILILDDALSAVDTYTEEEILSRLRGVMKGRTAIIISHRISTVRDADQIVVLDAGRVVEKGRHDELIRMGGHYAELYKKQLLEEELAAS